MTEPIDAGAAPEPRLIKSRASSKCKGCGKWIGPDELILYSQATGARHGTPERCATAKESAPIPPFDRTDPAVYWAEFEAVGRLLEAHPWTFAKTMPTIPHWWTVKRQWKDVGPDEFARVVLRIRQFGTKRKFKTMTNIKLDVNEHYYWTMDSPLSPPEVPTLINRAVRIQYEAPPLTWFPVPPDVSERQSTFLRRQIDGLRGRSVLDIGATWVDAAQRAKRYVAIATPGDLARLTEQVPTAATIETRLRHFVPRDPERFDIVAATWGAANHLELDELARLPLLVRDGGLAVVMFAKEGAGLEWSPGLWPAATVTEWKPFTLVQVQR